MSLVRLENVSKAFAGDFVLENVSFRVEDGEKIGLIGRNGTGKSTLFRLITGDTEPESGVIERMRRASMACLSQIPDVPDEECIFDTVMRTFGELTALERELRDLEERMADDHSVMERYSAVQEQFTMRGGYEFRTTVKRVLHGLGFTTEDYELPFNVLSGGQRTRLMLALILLQDADLLLLDEPENHLDMAAREWLEGYIKDSQKAVVIISHDRRMLDKVVDRIVEVERGQLFEYSGNYEYYLKHKALLREQQQKAYERQQEFIAKQESFINRFRYKANKASAVQSRVKQLEKLERVEPPPPEASDASFSLGEVVRSGAVVLDARHLSMAYGDLVLYEDVSFAVQRGERVGIIGPNGSGKTTLLRHLAGRLPEGRGEATAGHKVQLGFYDQHHENLSPGNDVLTEMLSARPDMRQEQMRTFLGKVLFTGEDVFKPVAGLSGGERARVSLAKLVLSDTNLLLLDEPTNHLDIASREALEAALAEFPGTLVMVSHDRELIDRFVDKLVVVDNGRAEVHLGNYSDYRRHLEEREPLRPDKPHKQEVLKIRRRTKEQERTERKVRREIEALEQEIASTEAQLVEDEHAFTEIDPADYEKANEMKGRYDRTKSHLESLYERWEQLADQLAE